MGFTNLKFPENSVFLVTGGAGFIGTNISETIMDLGYQVRCKADMSTGKKRNLD